MTDNTPHLLAELAELVARADDPDLVLAAACEELRDQPIKPRTPAVRVQR